MTDVSHIPYKDSEVMEYLNLHFSPKASLAAPVILPGELKLCSSAKVHYGNREWIQRWLSIAAVMQLHEAVRLAEAIKPLNCCPHTSIHPENGDRKNPDEMQHIVEPAIIRKGGNLSPLRYSPEMMKKDVRTYFQNFPTLSLGMGKDGFTVRFPFGEGFSSLFRGTAGYRHPEYLYGLRLWQHFPIAMDKPEEAYELAMLLNSIHVLQGEVGYGFGSYHYTDGTLQFETFLPNVGCTEDMLPNFYYSAAERALDISLGYTGYDFSGRYYERTRTT